MGNKHDDSLRSAAYGPKTKTILISFVYLPFLSYNDDHSVEEIRLIQF